MRSLLKEEVSQRRLKILYRVLQMILCTGKNTTKLNYVNPNVFPAINPRQSSKIFRMDCICAPVGESLGRGNQRPAVVANFLRALQGLFFVIVRVLLIRLENLTTRIDPRGTPSVQNQNAHPRIVPPPQTMDSLEC